MSSSPEHDLRERKGRKRHARWHLGRGKILRPAAAAAAVLLLSIGATVHTLALAIAYVDPVAAASLNPRDAAAQTAIATSLAAQEGQRALADEAAKHARRALMRDPTQIEAVEVLAALSERAGNEAATRQAFEYAAELTKRSFPTNMYFVREAALRNDTPEVFRRIDWILRTSTRGTDLLFPLMTQALSDEKSVGLIADRLAKPQPWANDFMVYAFDRTTSAEAIETIARRVWRAQGRPSDTVANHAIFRLIELGAVEPAYDLYVDFKPGQGDQRGIRAGSFTVASDRYPFDWEYFSNASSSGNRIERARTGNSGLAVWAGPGTTNDTVARQLLRLLPGNYTISARTVFDDTSQYLVAEIVVQCLKGGGSLLRMSLERERNSGMLAVPAGCEGQWLSVVANSTGSGIDGNLVVRELLLGRGAGGQ